ncbi:hypothetical protein CLIB1423_31S00430 [[Candida] railenensis]|uniref:Uncharacterized protein n=1 Tax=[Candida] railenensis TaxID=45579 RepID=A0A9P0QV67_9ASCO|nr:hypothetical protein CLIB1423_31S00430 [[Candida] railenensis]
MLHIANLNHKFTWLSCSISKCRACFDLFKPFSRIVYYESIYKPITIHVILQNRGCDGPSCGNRVVELYITCGHGSAQVMHASSLKEAQIGAILPLSQLHSIPAPNPSFYCNIASSSPSSSSATSSIILSFLFLFLFICFLFYLSFFFYLICKYI